MKNPVGKPRNEDAMRRVRKLRNVHRLSFRKIAEKMSQEDGRKYHLRSVYLWYHYK